MVRTLIKNGGGYAQYIFVHNLIVKYTTILRINKNLLVFKLLKKYEKTLKRHRISLEMEPWSP